MKKLFKIVLVSSLGLLCFSCYYNELPQPVEVEIVLPPGQEDISFSSNITPIFVTYNCAECHNPSGQSPDLTEGNEYNALVPTYVSAGNPTGSRLYLKLQGGHRSVDAESLEWIKQWIEAGAENN